MSAPGLPRKNRRPHGEGRRPGTIYISSLDSPGLRFVYVTPPATQDKTAEIGISIEPAYEPMDHLGEHLDPPAVTMLIDALVATLPEGLRRRYER